MDREVATTRLAAVLRISLGWIFLWPFLDKLFGWGFATKAGNGWIDGGSPTLGFLKFGTKGPFAEMFQPLAGNVVVDAVFMLGLLAIGVALILGVGVKIAAWSGTLMLFLMWLAVLPPEHNPFLDDHLIYGLMLLLLVPMRAGRTWGLGDWWTQKDIVKRYPWLE